MKIVNKKKFIKRIRLLIAIIIVFIVFMCNITFSHSEVKYKTIYVSDGDTLWSIAKNEKLNNKLYANMDIREIINKIKELNKLKNGNVVVGQELIIEE